MSPDRISSSARFDWTSASEEVDLGRTKTASATTMTKTKNARASRRKRMRAIVPFGSGHSRQHRPAMGGLRDARLFWMAGPKNNPPALIEPEGVAAQNRRT